LKIVIYCYSQGKIPLLHFPSTSSNQRENHKSTANLLQNFYITTTLLLHFYKLYNTRWILLLRAEVLAEVLAEEEAAVAEEEVLAEEVAVAVVLVVAADQLS
jgi:hypothetical protein